MWHSFDHLSMFTFRYLFAFVRTGEGAKLCSYHLREQVRGLRRSESLSITVTASVAAINPAVFFFHFFFAKLPIHQVCNVLVTNFMYTVPLFEVPSVMTW